ncbi:MAG: Crp/Fnr family transcriptional regulator [Desulfobacterales bacterium]
MVSKKDLKSIAVLRYLTDEMLDKLIPVTELLIFEEGEVIFKEGNLADRFYMLKRGKILLEKKISDHVTVSLGAIKSGYSFGWSAVLDGGPFTSDAVSAETSEIFSIKREHIVPLIENDHHMGKVLTQRFLREVKSRLDRRTEQFLRSVKSHPDMDVLLE